MLAEPASHVWGRAKAATSECSFSTLEITGEVTDAVDPSRVGDGSAHVGSGQFGAGKAAKGVHGLPFKRKRN